ncbi:MAG: hypothetical protein LAP87_18555 [Acidobacteriia bacterium]|nr:hypothetical protein [Terriglobia bacterium]
MESAILGVVLDSSIVITAERRRLPVPANDLLIAAAALEQDYAVLTENIRHFEKIPGLRVVKL